VQDQKAKVRIVANFKMTAALHSGGDSKISQNFKKLPNKKFAAARVTR
jgi:hypothetical protein